MRGARHDVVRCHGVWSLLVVALGDLADPASVVAGGVRYGSGGLAPRQQPQDLPPAALMGFVGGTVPLLKLRDAQMRG
jgi:hypothetical protein